MLITEPEAAALYCATLCRQVDLKVGNRFLICDAGGGTVVCIPEMPFPLAFPRTQFPSVAVSPSLLLAYLSILSPLLDLISFNCLCGSSHLDAIPAMRYPSDGSPILDFPLACLVLVNYKIFLFCHRMLTRL